MAKMYPPQIERDDPKRTGEYMVYDWLSSSRIPGVAFYSQPQTTHEKKIMSEVDFIYLSEDGILCIEVKGGTVHSHETQWMSTDKKGIDHNINHPFFQALGCMKALQTYFCDVYGEKSLEYSFKMGYCVVFPECICNSEGMGVVRELQFDARNEITQFGDFLKNAIQYNADDVYKKQQRRCIALSADDVERITKLIEADFGAIPSMKLQIDTAHEGLLMLTEEQQELVDNMAENQRILIQGAAGTGKSLMAIQKSNKAIAAKKSLLYLCFNKNMATYARTQMIKGDEVYVGTYNAMVAKYIGEKTNEMTVDQATEAFLAKDIGGKTYDVLVVDEAQDLLREKVIDVLDRLVKGGINGGEWAIFTDPNQNIFSDDNKYDPGVSLLKKNGLPGVFSLNTNCRNTAPIARKTAVLTVTPPAKHLKVSGPKVETIFYNQQEEAVEIIDKCIRGLLTGGTYSKDIVILSTRRLENSILSGTSEMAEMPLVEVDDIRKMDPRAINYLTAYSFKGLERKVVVYIDIDGFLKKDQRRINYVAMSRASVLLYMIIDNKLKPEYEQASVDGMDILS